MALAAFIVFTQCEQLFALWLFVLLLGFITAQNLFDVFGRVLIFDKIALVNMRIEKVKQSVG